MLEQEVARCTSGKQLHNNAVRLCSCAGRALQDMGKKLSSVLNNVPALKSVFRTLSSDPHPIRKDQHTRSACTDIAVHGRRLCRHRLA